MNRSSSTHCQTSLSAIPCGTLVGTNSTGKEKDSESGYHYFGARYYDSEALSGWLSVDPMADKYPSLSPYNYCIWNPMQLVDENGEFPTQKKALRARNRAVGRFGDDRVGGIWNRGTSSNPNYGFDVYGKGRNKYTRYSYSPEDGFYIIADRPDETVTSGFGLIRSRFKHRSYQFDISCSVGAQAGIEVSEVAGLDVNLCSAEIFNLSFGTEGGFISTIKDNDANCSSSLGISLGHNLVSGGVEYSGGEYIDKNSVKPFGAVGISILRNSERVKKNSSGIDITGSKGKVELGINAACIFGVRIYFSSEAQ